MKISVPQCQAVPLDLGGSALDAIVRALFGTSWGKARDLVSAGKISVGGTVVTDPLRRVRAGVEVRLTLQAPKPRRNALAREAFVHVDAHVVVIDKPSGISTVPYDETEDARGTLDGMVRAALPHGRGAAPSLGVVHRIDKETSGLIVFTRTWAAKQSLSAQFRAHTVHRRYLAIVHGLLVSARTFRSHLVPNRGDGLRGSTRMKGQGQLAITHVEPLAPLQGATLVACRLETGRTHQIRIHVSEAGHPILGERVYVRGYSGLQVPAARMMLHAAELGFQHPGTGGPVRWSREPPADFAETLARLRAKG